MKSILWKQVGFGVLLATAFSLVGLLVFALAIKLFSLPSAVISPVDRVVRTAAVLLGCFFGCGREKGWLKGLFVGVLSVFTTGFLFFLIGGGEKISWLSLLELPFGALVGTLGGILAVNIRK